jgi:hypothetical protein
MANYALTRYDTGLKDTVEEALAALETQLETVDSTLNVIRGMGIELTGRDRQQAIGWVIYDT